MTKGQDDEAKPLMGKKAFKTGDLVAVEDYNGEVFVGVLEALDAQYFVYKPCGVDGVFIQSTKEMKHAEEVI